MEFTSKNKKIILISLGALIIIALSGLLYLIFNQKKDETIIKIGGQEVVVEVADNEIEKYKGLSGRESLLYGNGMLFLFDGYDNRSFVMRDMKFPLDIVFIKDGMVTEVRKNAAPEGENPEKIYTSGAKIDMVLELPGGYCDKYGIEAGTSMSFVKR